MLKLIALGCLAFFTWQLFTAWRNGVVMGQGWWGRICYYERDEQPFMFYGTTLAYLLASFACLWLLKIA